MGSWFTKRKQVRGEELYREIHERAKVDKGVFRNLLLGHMDLGARAHAYPLFLSNSKIFRHWWYRMEWNRTLGAKPMHHSLRAHRALLQDYVVDTLHNFIQPHAQASEKQFVADMESLTKALSELDELNREAWDREAVSNSIEDQVALLMADARKTLKSSMLDL